MRSSQRLALLVCLVAIFTRPVSGDQPKVLLIGIDGLRSDALREARTPVLDRLAKRGRIDRSTRVTADEVTNSDTVSGPGWTTFLTGTWADRHGVVDNSFDGRDRSAAPHVFTLAKRSRPELRTASFLNWTPMQEFITTDADVNVVVNPGPLAGNPGKKDYAAADATVSRLATETIRNENLDLAFVYFGAVDETGHLHGFHPTVKPYVDQIETVDALVGGLVAAVESRPKFDDEDWMYVISTDHGGEGLGHGGGRGNPYVFRAPMIVSGRGLIDQTSFDDRKHATVDVVAVALAHLGIDAADLPGDPSGWLGSDQSAEPFK